MTFGAYIVGLVCSLFAYLYVHCKSPLLMLLADTKRPLAQ